MPVSQTEANIDLDAVYGSGTPAVMYVALVTTTPSFTGAGAIVEPTAGQYQGYAEQSIPNNATNWPASSNGTKSNAVPITFPVAGAASTGASLTHIVFLTTSGGGGGGRIIDAIPLPNGTSVIVGQALSFPAGSITITES